MTKEDSLCCSEYSYPLSFLLKECVRGTNFFFFCSKSLRKGYLFGQKWYTERNGVGPQGWVSPYRWIAPTERKLFLDKRFDNIQSERQNLTGDDDHSVFTTRKKVPARKCCLILHIIFHVDRNP